MKYQAAFFDFDYTLGDATEAIYAAFCYAMEAMGHPTPDLETVRGTVGMLIHDAYTLLTGDPSVENRERFYRLFHPVARDMQAQGKVELLPGAVELMRGLKEAGLSTALVSTKNTGTLNDIIRIKGLQGLFDLVVGGGTVPSHKPDPEGVFYALDTLKLDRSRVLYCGDTTIDAQTAQNAGVDFCPVLNGTTPAEAFADYPHVHISPDLWDLKSWLGV